MADTAETPTPEPDAPPAADPPAPPVERSFSQAELNAILARQKRELLADAGDLAELRDKAKRLDDLEAQSQTELERERNRADSAVAEAQKIREAAERRLVEAAVLTEATKQKAIKPEHLHRLIDTGSVTVGDDGQVAGVGEAVTAFLEANPEYVGRTASPSGSADQGARPGGANQLTRDALANMSNEEIVKAQREGRLDNLLGVK